MDTTVCPHTHTHTYKNTNEQGLSEFDLILKSICETENRAQGRYRFQNIWEKKYDDKVLPYTVSITRWRPAVEITLHPTRNNAQVPTTPHTDV